MIALLTALLLLLPTVAHAYIVGEEIVITCKTPVDKPAFIVWDARIVSNNPPVTEAWVETEDGVRVYLLPTGDNEHWRRRLANVACTEETSWRFRGSDSIGDFEERSVPCTRINAMTVTCTSGSLP